MLTRNAATLFVRQRVCATLSACMSVCPQLSYMGIAFFVTRIIDSKPICTKLERLRTTSIYVSVCGWQCRVSSVVREFVTFGFENR